VLSGINILHRLWKVLYLVSLWYYPGIRLKESIKFTIHLIRIIDIPDVRYIRFLNRIQLNAKWSILRRSGITLSVCKARNLIL